MPDADNLTSALDAIRDRRARSTSCVSARDLPDGDNRSAASAADVPRLLAAVDAVLAIHKVTETANGHSACVPCSREEGMLVSPGSCSIRRAISRELTGGTDD